VIEKEVPLKKGSRGWHLFLPAEGTLLGKERYELNLRKFVSVPMLRDAVGLAVSTAEYGKGAERIVFHCHEVCMHACIHTCMYIYIYI
jgi:hypothetical protein